MGEGDSHQATRAPVGQRGGTRRGSPSPRAGRDPKKHQSRQSVWLDVKRAAKALLLPQNVAPHSARKVFAVDLMA